MTIGRTRKLSCITIGALALSISFATLADELPHSPSAPPAPPAPAAPARPAAPVAIPDSTPSGKRTPYCPNFLGRLQSNLVKLLDDSTSVKLETRPEARPGSLLKASQNARDKMLERIKVHFYKAVPIEVLETAIDVKATYVAIDKSGLYAAKIDRTLSDQYAAEVEATIRSAETYPARWHDLMDIEAQAQLRQEQLEKLFAEIKEKRVQQEQWLKSLTSERNKLDRLPAGHSVELELPVFNEQGEFQIASHRVKFDSLSAARKAISETESKLNKGIKFNGPYWVELPAVRQHDIYPIPHSYSFGSRADFEIAINKLKALEKTLKGGYTTEGSYLNAAAGQVVNLKQLETIREVLREQRQELQTSGVALSDDSKKYFDTQIARIDAIIDHMNVPKEGFAPPQIAYQKVRTRRLFKEVLGLPRSLKDDINKPIRSRKQWDNMGKGVIDSSSNGNPEQPGLNIGTTNAPAPPPATAPGSTTPQTPPSAPNPIPPTNPDWGNPNWGNPSWGNSGGNFNFGWNGGQTSWLTQDVGVAGQITPPMTGGVFSRFKERNTPLSVKYDAVMAKLAAIDPAIIQAAGLSKAGTAMALWRGGKLFTYIGVPLAIAQAKGAPAALWDSALSVLEKSDKAQIKLCAAQGTTPVGNLTIETDPTQNAGSDQAFQDCSIAFIKTKFVKEYLDELSNDSSTVKKDKEGDSIEIDPKKIATGNAESSFFKKGTFVKNKQTGEIYIKPDLTSVAFKDQPGVNYDRKLNMMKLDLAKVPVASSNGVHDFIVEKDPTSGHLIFHVDRIAADSNGLYTLNDNHEIVASPRIMSYVERLKKARIKVTGYTNMQSNIDSILRQLFTPTNPCSDPIYTRWMTAKTNAEFKAGFMGCISHAYPGFIKLGDTSKLVSDLLDADVKKQPDLLKPLVTMNANFGNYICTVLSQRAVVVDPSSAMTTQFICQNLSGVNIGNNGWGMGGWGGFGNTNPGGGWNMGANGNWTTVTPPISGATGATGSTGQLPIWAQPGNTTPQAPAPTSPAAGPGNTAPGVPNYIPGLSGPPGPGQSGPQF